MIDGHVHLERGPYTRQWVERFVQQAQARGIRELLLLEHSHRFHEFRSMYREVEEYNEYQRRWLDTRCVRSLGEYAALAEALREESFPVRLRFGLEVCYMPGREEEVSRLLEHGPWDFITGAVHWINGWGFDHPASIAEWEAGDHDEIWGAYYRAVLQCIESGLFDTLAHPDSIKCWYHYPRTSPEPWYEEVAEAAANRGIAVEYSCGLFLNYLHSELGPDIRLLRALLRRGVRVVTASDAHCPKDAGRYIPEAVERLKAEGQAALS